MRALAVGNNRRTIRHETCSYEDSICDSPGRRTYKDHSRDDTGDITNGKLCHSLENRAARLLLIQLLRQSQHVI